MLPWGGSAFASPQHTCYVPIFSVIYSTLAMFYAYFLDGLFFCGVPSLFNLDLLTASLNVIGFASIIRLRTGSNLSLSNIISSGSKVSCKLDWRGTKMPLPNYQFKCSCGAFINTRWNEADDENRNSKLLFVLPCLKENGGCGRIVSFEGWQGRPLA
jgi:hypothetical protein